MAKIALIQNIYPTLNQRSSKSMAGLAKQVYDRFFEVLVEESGHVLQRAETLEEYLAANHEAPAVVICAPLAEIGNIAPGLAELKKIRETFPTLPIIVWTNRQEEAVRQAVLEVANSYYTGNLLSAPDDLADMVLDFIK